ncbi:hypothetical protein MHYP_G00141090 [Metynnis hypsauchen]
MIKLFGRQTKVAEREDLKEAVMDAVKGALIGGMVGWYFGGSGGFSGGAVAGALMSGVLSWSPEQLRDICQLTPETREVLSAAFQKLIQEAAWACVDYFTHNVLKASR